MIAATYATPPIAPSCEYGDPSRPCAHSHRHMPITTLITTIPARAVAWQVDPRPVLVAPVAAEPPDQVGPAAD